jgi:hypothetical protein
VSQAQSASVSHTPAPAPSFEFFSRQLLWEHALEFLTFCSTVFDWGYLATAAAWTSRRVTRMIRDMLPTSLVRGPPAVLSGQSGFRGCAFCGISPAMQPHAAACGHTFCYYCVSAAFTADGALRCPACDAPITEIGWAT